MKRKIITKVTLILFLAATLITMSFNIKNDDGLTTERDCQRKYIVYVLSTSGIPLESTGVVKLSFTDGTILEKNWDRTISEYWFPEHGSYPQIVCAYLVLDTGNSSNTECKLVTSRPPCDTPIATIIVDCSSLLKPID